MSWEALRSCQTPAFVRCAEGMQLATFCSVTFYVIYWVRGIRAYATHLKWVIPRVIHLSLSRGSKELPCLSTDAQMSSFGYE